MDDALPESLRNGSFSLGKTVDALVGRACQYVLTSWMLLSSGQVPPAELESYLLTMLKQIANCEVANRRG